MPTRSRRFDSSHTPAVLIYLGHEIRSIREEQRLTIDEVARQTGVDRKTITHLELGQAAGARFMTVYLIADVLGVSIDDLLPSDTERES